MTRESQVLRDRVRTGKPEGIELHWLIEQIYKLEREDEGIEHAPFQYIEVDMPWPP